MQRVVVLGRGGAGKSTFVRRLAGVTGLPRTELDELFWSADSTPEHPLPRERWAAIQRELVAADGWILDGDLGRFDVLEPRLSAADTIVVLDFPLGICARRAVRRSRESLVFWRWVIGYRRRSLPGILATIARCAPAPFPSSPRSRTLPRRAAVKPLPPNVIGPRPVALPTPRALSPQRGLSDALSVRGPHPAGKATPKRGDCAEVEGTGDRGVPGLALLCETSWIHGPAHGRELPENPTAETTAPTGPFTQSPSHAGVTRLARG